MFDFFRRQQPRPPRQAVAQALIRDGLPAGTDSSALLVVERGGAYSGRQVKYFRVFDPVRTAERAIKVRIYGDLDAHPELVVGSGHVEREGNVVFTRKSKHPSS